MKKLVLALSAAIIVGVLTTCLAYASFSSKSSNAGGEDTGAVTLPGDWSLACLPTLKPQPVVDAYSVTTNASKGLTITHVGVKNQTDKNAAAIKLGWRLFLEEDPKTNLRQGVTPLLGVSLSPGERRVMEFPVVNASKVLATMLTDGKLRGKFRIEVAVTEVLFDEHAKTSNVREFAGLIRTVSWRNSPLGVEEVTSYADPTSVGEACQDQVCTWAQAQCYQCTAEAGFGCTVNNCNSCTETRCPPQQ
jgi:hypothetical protein